MAGHSIVLHFTGDPILDAPGPERYFAPARDQLRAADVLVGQVEVPHTDRGYEESTDATGNLSSSLISGGLRPGGSGGAAW